MSRIKLDKDRLSDAEDERLAVLVEEMSEVTQIVEKIRRNGFDSNNPLKPDSPTNRELLEKELGHVQNAIRMMYDAADVSRLRVIESELVKKDTIKEWLYFN